MAEDTKRMAAPDSPEEMSRRRFFVKVGVGSAVVAALGTAGFAYQYLSPNVLYEPSPIVDAGKPDHYPPDSVTMDPQTAIYVVRTGDGFFALSAICTHLGCLTAYNPDLGVIACPCHGSKFNRDGVKIEGPAPKPLPWLRMWLSDDGNLMVDRSNAVAIKQLVRV
jgi:cytochrome b6-f complex iron-sulfur subunit